MQWIAFLVLLCFYACTYSQAKDRPEQNEGDIVLSPITESNPDFNPAEQHALIGGREANPADFPASFYSKQGNSRCTAFLIGDDVLSLAAHCVGNGKSAMFSANGKDYTSVCSHSPDYKTNVTADWALCKVSEKVAGVPAEVIASEDVCKVGETILLTGYGCTEPGGTGGNDGKYRIGESKVKSCPKDNDFDIETEGPAAVCFGDSGGPSFLLFPDGSRKALANTSRGDIQKYSYLSSFSNPKYREFALSWSNTSGSKICGLHAQATGCRGSSPDPNPLPEWCRPASDKHMLCLYGNPRLALTDPQGCRDALVTAFACQEIAERSEP